MYRGQFVRGSSYCTPKTASFFYKKKGFGRWEWQAGTSCEARLLTSRGVVFTRQRMAVMASRAAYSNAYRLLWLIWLGFGVACHFEFRRGQASSCFSLPFGYHVSRCKQAAASLCFLCIIMCLGASKHQHSQAWTRAPRNCCAAFPSMQEMCFAVATFNAL